MLAKSSTLLGRKVFLRLIMLRYTTFPVTDFAQNCSLVWCTQSHQAALVDPGGEADKLADEVHTRGLELRYVLLTHGHLDHVGAALAIREQFSCPIVGPHPDDEFLLRALPMQAQMFGFAPAQSFTPDQWLYAGDDITLGNSELQVRHCPGHTPGHIVLFDAQEQRVWAGDVLFQGSIGRTDFPRGCHATLLESIRTQLFTLDDAVDVVPGHGPNTTIGQERKHNPFLR